MPTPSSRAVSQQQTPSATHTPQPSCPEDYPLLAHSQPSPPLLSAAMNTGASPDPESLTAAGAIIAAASPSLPRSDSQDHYAYDDSGSENISPRGNGEEEEEEDLGEPQSPFYAPTSPPTANRREHIGLFDSSMSQSTNMSPRPPSSAKSSGSGSPISNTATSPAPNDDEEPKAADVRGDVSMPSASRSRPFPNDHLMDIDGGRLVINKDWNDYSNQSPALAYGITPKRVVPGSPSSYLRPGSRFKGTQTSERSVYNVDVEIQHVDMRESFLCGYLHIEGLTPENPSICTYFEGEIIGPKYGFLTKHMCWGADERTDMSHWSKFAAFRPYQKNLKKGVVQDVDFSQKENIFMRWKEHFLVPDHRKSSIPGASFEGFYYICFNQVRGEVTGIYFHAKSEKFQQLELQHIQNHWRFNSIEFR